MSQENSMESVLSTFSFFSPVTEKKYFAKYWYITNRSRF